MDGVILLNNPDAADGLDRPRCLTERIDETDEKKEVALVLAGGGPGEWPISAPSRELESQGFEIAAVAGTSMGALVGGHVCLGPSDGIQGVDVFTRQVQGFRSGGFRPQFRGAGQG